MIRNTVLVENTHLSIWFLRPFIIWELKNQVPFDIHRRNYFSLSSLVGCFTASDRTDFGALQNKWILLAESESCF